MINRRDAIRVAAAALPLKLLAGAPAPEQLKHAMLMTQDLANLEGGDWMVTVQQLEYAPGGTSEAHRHNGFTFVYVVEGQLVAKIDDGDEKTYTPGQMFYEPPLHLHAVSRNASQTAPAKFLVFRVIQKGKPGTVPAR